jgi:hypothetical protein
VLPGTALTILWEAADRICGKRLKQAIPALVDAMERYGHLRLQAEVRRRLLGMSAAAMVVREQTLITVTVEEVRVKLPFPMLGLDLDNASAFINRTAPWSDGWWDTDGSKARRPLKRWGRCMRWLGCT